MNRLYAIYDMNDYEQCVGVFDTPNELAEYFNTTSDSVLSNISRGNWRENRYEIVRLHKRGKKSGGKPVKKTHRKKLCF